jgi:dipeptidyl aminopeptidase/acylaminoacyl peptidase
LRVLMFAFVWLAFPTCVPVQAEGRVLTLDDMLKMEGFGHAVFDPSGRWLIYERQRSYEANSDFSYGLYAAGRIGHELWKYDLDAGGVPMRLPGIDPDSDTRLESISPEGRYISLLQYKRGHVAFGIFDTKDDRLIQFGRAPVDSRTGGQDPVWISEGRLIFAALPSGDQPRSMSVRADTGQKLTHDWHAAWSGRTVTAREARSYSADHADVAGPGCLALADGTNGAETCLAEGQYTDLCLSPDGRILAGLRMWKSPVDISRPLMEDNSERFRLVLFHTEDWSRGPGGLDLSVMPYSLEWSPDGKFLAFFGWEPGKSPRQGGFYLIDVATGRARRLLHNGLDLVSERERGWAQRPERAVFFGDRLAVYARPASDPAGIGTFTYRNPGETGLARADWYALTFDAPPENLTAHLRGVSGIPVSSGEAGVQIIAEDGVYLLDASDTERHVSIERGDPIRQVRQGSALTRSGVIRPQWQRDVLLVSGQGAAQLFVLQRLAAGHANGMISFLPADETAVPIAASADTILYQTRKSGEARLLIASLEDGVRELDRINSHLSGIDPVHWEKIAYEVNAGAAIRQLENCILLPPDYQKGHAVPLIVEVYPGAPSLCGDMDPTRSGMDVYSPYLWAAEGIAYVRLALPTELIRTEDGPIAAMPALVEAGVNALVEQGYADPDQIVLHGLSQGGISALYVAAKTDLFAGVIAQNSWSDLISHYFGPAGIFADFSVDGLGAQFRRYESRAGSAFGLGQTPFDDPEIYYRNSPVLLASDIECPVMLIHSDMDAFDDSQFDEMYAALARQGKDVRYVLYRGEGHVLSSPANIRDMWRRKLEFLGEVGVRGPAP